MLQRLIRSAAGLAMGGALFFAAGCSDDPSGLDVDVFRDCTSLPRASVPTARNGTLALSDCEDSFQLPIDYYVFRVDRQTDLTFIAESDDFDTELILWALQDENDEDGDLLEYNDDRTDFDLNSEFSTTLFPGNIYVVAVGTVDGGIGPYTLRILED